MRMARERSHSGNVHGRPGSRALLLGGVAFALILAGIVSVTLANHATTTWDFGTSSDYTYDPNKILVEGGVAHLRKSFTVTHSTQADFNGSGGNTGTYSSTGYNTNPPAAGVKLSSPPTVGTYTSPVIDAGVATTTWKTLSHVRDLQQAAPPATFGAKTSVLPTGRSAPRNSRARSRSRAGRAPARARAFWAPRFRGSREPRSGWRAAPSKRHPRRPLQDH